MIDTWERAWGQFTPFLDFPIELRQIVYTTNAIESLNARFRKAVRHRVHFPTEQAALKVLYLVAAEKGDRTDPPRPDGSTPGRQFWLYAAKAGWRPRILRVGTVVHVMPHGVTPG